MADPNNQAADIEASLAALGKPVTPTVAPTSYGPTLDKVLGYARSYLAGPTFNLADEAEAKVASLFSGRSYEQELADIAAQNKAFSASSPVVSTALPIASGLVLNPLGAIGQVGKTGTATSTVGKLVQPVVEKAVSVPGGKVVQALVSSVPSQAFVAGYGAGEGDSRISTGLLTGALGTAGSVVSNVGGRFLTRLGTEADRMKLSAYNLSPADVSRNIKEYVAKKAGIPSAEKIPVVQTLKSLESKGLINPEADVLTNAANIEVYKRTLGAELGTVLEDANKLADPFADFQMKNVNKYLSNLGGTAKEEAQKLITKERDAIISQFEEGGSLLDLQKAKTGLNYAWDQSPLTPTVQKAIRQDLREEIENRLGILAKLGKVPEEALQTVKTLNKQFGDAADLSTAFLGKAGKVLSGNVMEDIAGQARTSGGAGTLAQMSTQSGNVVPALAGALMQAGRSQAGKNYLATIMEDPAVQQIASKLGYALTEGGTGRTFAQLATPYIKPSETKLELTTSGKLVEVPKEPTPTFTADEVEKLLGTLGRQVVVPEKQNISDLIGNQPPLIKAIIQTESAGKPQAKSKKGATGLMQLMPATAKSLGVDPTDPVQNIEGGTRYINQMMDKFGDEKLALAAYNWGPGNLQRAIARTQKEGLKPTWENILEVAYVPAETRKYVSKVITKRNEYSNNTVAESDIVRTTTDKNLSKYDDYDLAKIADAVGQSKLDKVLAKYGSKQKFTVGDIVNALNLDPQELGVNIKSVLGKA